MTALLWAACVIPVALLPTPAWGAVTALVLRAATGRASSQPPEGLVPPRLASPLVLEYPEALARVPDPPEGIIVMYVVIGVDGRAVEISVKRGLHPTLDALARQALQQASFEPATYQDQPVEVALDIPVEVAAPPPPGPATTEPSPSSNTEPVPAAASPGPVSPAPVSPEPSPDNGRAVESGQNREDAASLATPAEGAPALLGQLLEAISRRPLAGISVYVSRAPADAQTGRVDVQRLSSPEEFGPGEAWSVEATSDEEGHFEFESLPSGKLRVVVFAPGMRRVEWIEERAADEAVSVRYFLEPEAVNPYRTVVSDQIAREEIGRKSLTAAEVANLPGTQGDALRALQSLPGVARPPYGAGLLVIRGAAPFDSAVYLAEHGLPLAFHFGGLSTAINSDVLESVSFVPSNFDVRWGNAIGGVVSVTPRKGRRDGIHGYIDADIIDASALLEGPLHKGSFLASIRRSYIDAVLPLFVPEASLQLTRAPRYWDYSLFIDHPLGPGEVTIRLLGGDDRFEFLARDPNDDTLDDRNRSGAQAFVHRADLVYKVRHRGWDLDISPSARWEFGAGQNGGSFDLRVDRKAFTGRASISGPLARRVRLELGTETYLLWYDINAASAPIQGSAVPGGESLLGPTSPGTLDDQQIEDLQAFSTTLAVYASTILGEGTPLRVVPGVRLTHWGFPMNRARVDPRLRMIWDVSDETTLRAGAGLFSQTPVFQDLTPAFGNPDLVPLRAAHTSLELVQRFEHGLELTISGFFNRMWDLPAPSEELVLDSAGALRPVRLRSDGLGQVYGGEVLLRKDLTRALVGWISYTLSRSERRWPSDGGWVPYEYDQTHALSALLGVALPRHWRVGGRFRLTSGNPTTPITAAVFDGSTGAYLPIEGPRNSERLPVFYQLDLRVDKQFFWRYLKLNLYLDLQNATNRPNVEFWAYAFDYRTRAAIRGLPILPSLGARLEF